jgi:hypothetical protein
VGTLFWRLWYVCKKVRCSVIAARVTAAKTYELWEIVKLAGAVRTNTREL